MQIKEYVVSQIDFAPKEKYVVCKGGKLLGHIEIRHRHFIVLVEDNNDLVCVVSAIIDGDGLLLEHERQEWLEEAVDSIDEYIRGE